MLKLLLMQISPFQKCCYVFLSHIRRPNYGMLKGGGNPDPNSRFKPKSRFLAKEEPTEAALYCGENGLETVFTQPTYFRGGFRTNTFGKTLLSSEIQF